MIPPWRQFNSKYKAVRTEVDGILFASKGEAQRYWELKMMQNCGEITDLELQPRYPIVVNGEKICTYVADFRYTAKDGTKIVEDYKGFRTPIFKLKKKLMRACYGINVVET